jgi:hypothetical protein
MRSLTEEEFIRGKERIRQAAAHQTDPSASPEARTSWLDR